MFLISKKGENWKNDAEEDLTTDRFIYKKILEDRAIILWEIKIKSGKEMPARGKEIFEEEDDDSAKNETWEEFIE
jgi:hypothetical protein